MKTEEDISEYLAKSSKVVRARLRAWKEMVGVRYRVALLLLL